MKPQFVADAFTALILELRAKGSSRSNRDRILGPYSKNDNQWELDKAKEYWLRINESEKQYILSCRYQKGELILSELKTLFEKQYPISKK